MEMIRKDMARVNNRVSMPLAHRVYPGSILQSFYILPVVVPQFFILSKSRDNTKAIVFFSKAIACKVVSIRLLCTIFLSKHE